MKNMKVNVRMILNIGIILLLSVITIVVAESASITAQNSYSEAINRDMNSALRLMQVRANVNDAGRQLRDMVLTGYDAATSAAIDNNVTIIEDSLQGLIDSYPLDDGGAASYKQAVDNWRSVASTIRQEIQAGRLNEAEEQLINECTPALNSLRDTGMALNTTLNNLIDDKWKHLCN